MKKFLLTILISGGLLLISSNYISQQVFAQSSCTHNGECIDNQLCYCPAGGTVCEDGHSSFVFSGECGNSTSESTDIQLNFGDIAKEKNVIGTGSYDTTNASAGFGALMTKILTIVVIIAAIMLLIMLLWGAMEWITAGGDKSKIEKARNRITQSIIGMIVLAGTLAIFSLMQTLLNFRVFNINGGTGSNINNSGNDSNSNSCVVTGNLENDGGTGHYCTNGGAAMVKCIPPEGIYQSNHYTPCYCLDGNQYNRSDLNFSLCN